MGLDPAQPYSLGNKDYYYKRECNSGHKDLKDEEISLTGGYYDGYNWTVPCCLRCIKADKEYPHVMQHSHNSSVHLVEVKGEELKLNLICQDEVQHGNRMWE